jgi:hypothetical protein
MSPSSGSSAANALNGGHAAPTGRYSKDVFAVKSEGAAAVSCQQTPVAALLRRARTVSWLEPKDVGIDWLRR